GLGQDIQQFAMQFDVYRRVKEQDSKVQFALEWKNRSTLMAQEAERFVRTNPNAAPDGSSVQSDFDSSYGRIYADIDSLEDPEQKRAAKNIADQVAAKYKQGLLTYEIGKYNKFSEESIQKASDDMTLIISNDPTKFAEALADFENAINSQVNLSADMKAKLIPAAR